MSLAQLKAMGADRGVVPVAFEIGGQILTKPVRAHADGRVDLVDVVDGEPVYTAVLYEGRLEHVSSEEVLWHIPYFGQVVRIGAPEVIFAKRKREHENDAVREDKEMGLHAVIDMYGPDALEWRIVSSASGPRLAMQELANSEEIRLISENGGMLRDMDTKLEQTLNLTEGGRGDAAKRWAGIDAKRRRALTRFKVAMETYVKEFGSALVPRGYVDDDGYPLGVRLGSFRGGSMRKGMPDMSHIDAWAEALPEWAWNSRETDAYRNRMLQNRLWRSRQSFVDFQAAMEAYVHKYGSALVPRTYVDANKYSLGSVLADFRQGHMHKGTSWEEEAIAWAQALPQWAWNAKGCDAYRLAIGEANKKHQANKLRIELERARQIAKPFEKSKKRRSAMYAVCTDFSGRKGNAVLYMLSEDSKTIRRVSKNGDLCNRNTVGPVVDADPSQAPPPEAETANS